MSRLRNKVNLIGRLGKDPEIKRLESGQIVANFSIATSETFKDKEGQKQEKTEWHNIVAWGKLAEIIEKYVKKGDEIVVEGKLTNRSWEDKEGHKRYTTEVLVREMLMLGGKKGEGSENKEDLPF